MILRRFTLTFIMLTLTFVLGITLSWGASSQDSENIKVGLKYGSNAGQSYSLKSDEGFILCSVQNGMLTEGMPLPAFTSVRVFAKFGAVVLMDENDTLLSADLGNSTIIMPLNYEDNGGIITFENTPYRGGVIFTPNSNGSISAANYLSIEHYIYGVLNSELHHTNPGEALKAQAVAARSFGVLNKKKHSSEGFDVCLTTHCQVYKGYSGEYEATNKAVDDTLGEMIFYGEKPVAAYYFKNSGGYTQDVVDVWSFAEPYLTSVEDEYSPSYPWTASFTYDTLKSKLQAAGYNPGEIRSVTIKDRCKTGNVSCLEIVGSQSTISLQKEKVRNVLGATVVKSLNFTLEDGASTQPNQKVMVSNGTNTSSLDDESYLISGNGQISRHSTKNLFAFNSGSPVKLVEGDGIIAETNVNGTVTFKGYGYGHGVGMPQDSAIEMAKKGFTYVDILKKYYTGIDIKTY